MIRLYNKNGTVKLDIKEYEYVGNFMGERKITFKVYSEKPITFNIGDYALFRAETYKIYEIPPCTKRAEKLTYGSAFEYDVTLDHIIQELAECSFLDYVINDTQIHYSNFSNPSFYGSANDLAERIQVNLERLYTGWKIYVDPSYTSEILNIQVNNLSCLGALGLFSSLFKTTFTVNEKTVIIGSPIGQVSGVFFYQNGLETIEESRDSSSRIITRLRAYGSKDNLPIDYNKNKGVYPESFYAPGLMLPNSYVAGIDYIDSSNISIYGIREASVYFDGTNSLEKIYPTISGMTAEQLMASGVSVNSTGALDVIVSSSPVADENQANVTITIKDIGFDINDYLGTGASIVMKSGECVGSELQIVSVVKTEEEDGYILTVSRKNEGSFYIPNLTQNVKSGDKFVLVGIQMPDVYVLSAEQRLLTAAQNWLSKNDKEIKRYSSHIDNYEIFQYGIILKEGLSIEMADVDLNINENPVIQSLTIKYGGEIPIHEVTLSETSREGFNEKIQRLAREAYVSAATTSESSSYLSKIHDDIANGFISFLRGISSNEISKFIKGIEIGNYSMGALGGGAAFKMVNGISELEVDKLTVRMMATFYELVISKLTHVGGQIVLTPARMKCNAVEETDTTYKCFFDTGENGEVVNEFVSGDQARCQVFSGSGMKFYWRLVTAVGIDYIELSKTRYLGDGIPAEGDDIVQLGNINDVGRQNAQVLSTVGADAPSWKQYKQINSFSLEGKETTVFSGFGNKIQGSTVFTPGGKNLYEWMDETSADRLQVLQGEIYSIDARLTADVNSLLDNIYLAAYHKDALTGYATAVIGTGGAIDVLNDRINDILLVGGVIPDDYRYRYNSALTAYYAGTEQLEYAIRGAREAIEAEIKRLADSGAGDTQGGGANELREYDLRFDGKYWNNVGFVEVDFDTITINKVKFLSDDQNSWADEQGRRVIL